MSALARYFLAMDVKVAGYDRVETSLTTALSDEGAEIEYRDDFSRIPEWFLDTPTDRALVVYTPAVPKSNAIYSFLSARGLAVVKRAELLAMITEGRPVIAVAGTHGKTTTSTMAAHILHASGVGCNAFLGGISANYNTNILFDSNNELVVVEADEYDRSLLKLKPNTAVITSVEGDHLDVYGNEDNLKEGFRIFANLIPGYGRLFLKHGLDIRAGCPITTYHVDDQSADIHARNIRVEDGKYAFEVMHEGRLLGEIRMSYPGRHNVENALAAIGICLHHGVSWDAIRDALESFRGVKRRFEYVINRPDRVFIDDYAHHPTEIKAFVSSVKELYPARPITGVFQPHLYSRTRDFADGFAESLSLLDHLLLMDIYPAREEPIEGIDSEWLLNKVRTVNKKLSSREELVSEVLKLSPEILLTMGAGDIDKMVEPLKNALDEKDEESR